MCRFANQHHAGIADEIEKQGKNVWREQAIAVGRNREPLRCLTDSMKNIAILHGPGQGCKRYSQYRRWKLRCVRRARRALGL